MDATPVFSTATPAQVVVVEGSEKVQKVQRDRRPLLITLGLPLALLGLIIGSWLALRQSNTVLADPKLARQFAESGNQKISRDSMRQRFRILTRRFASTRKMPLHFSIAGLPIIEWGI